MRQIGTLTDGDAARALADYLLTLRIETQLQREAGGWAVWVCDEDRVPQARQELEAFSRNPSDPRYAEAARAAREVRRREARAEEVARHQQVDLGERFRSPWSSPRPVTSFLIAASVVASLAAGTLLSGLGGGDYTNNRVFQALVIAPFEARGGSIWWERLRAVRQGEVWRLVTPIFLHFGPLHLLFNLLMLGDLGAQVEARRGPWRYLLLVLALAASSDLGQYYYGHFEWGGPAGLVPYPAPSPLFGGMSGVNYGLLGYVWMKARHEPDLGIVLHPSTLTVGLLWFFLCLAGAVGSVANTAHAVGLALGIAVGYAPTLWRSLRG
jgi:GlpG protein